MSQRFAVIGFDAQLDGLENIDRVAAAFYLGQPYKSEQHLLSSENKSSLYYASANRVVKASGLTKQRIAVIVIDPQQGLDFNDPDYLEINRVVSFIDAIALSVRLIKRLDSAVLIITANIAEQRKEQDLATFSYDQQFVDYGETSGVACVLLAKEAFARTHHCYTYSYLKGYCISDDLSNLEDTISDAFKRAEMTSIAITALEVSGLNDDSFCLQEQSAILKGYANDLRLNTAVSCIKSVIGDCGALSDLCGLLNTVFSLQQRYYSCVKQWIAPQEKQLSDWINSPFYFVNEPILAFPKQDGTARVAALSCMTDKQYGHFIVQENNDHMIHENGFNAHCDLSLFIIRGNSQQQLVKKLKDLDNEVDKSDFKALSQQYYQASLDNIEQRYCLVLVARSIAKLKNEITLALSGLSHAFEQHNDWKTPQGSYLCVDPDIDVKTCFLYPGIGATYLGLGQSLLQLFPAIYPYLQELTQNSVTGGKYHLLQPRSVTRLTSAELKQHDLALRTKLADIAECGVGYACLFTYLFRDLLNIDADFAAGYSMGEVSMFTALNCWQDPGQMSERLANSSTFTNELAGELNTVRSLWNIADSEQLVWESYNIKGNVEQVSAAMQPDERVYITLINTHDSLVIAGHPDDCLALARRLNVRALPLNVHNAIHCPIADRQFEQMVDLYTMDLAERVPTKLYSSSCYLPIPFNKKAIAVSIAKCLCQRVDFPRMINTLKAQGANVFIEMGAGRSLGTWVDKILTQHANIGEWSTIAVNAKGANQQLMIARAVAKLLSVGVALDVNSYFYGSIIVNNRTSIH